MEETKYKLETNYSDHTDPSSQRSRIGQTKKNKNFNKIELHTILEKKWRENVFYCQYPAKRDRVNVSQSKNRQWLISSGQKTGQKNWFLLHKTSLQTITKTIWGKWAATPIAEYATIKQLVTSLTLFFVLLYTSLSYVSICYRIKAMVWLYHYRFLPLCLIPVRNLFYYTILYLMNYKNYWFK